MSEQDDPLAAHTVHQRIAAAPAAEAFRHVLMLHRDNAAPQRIVLPPLPFLVGRAPPAELVLEGATISRRHCQFELRNDRVLLTDLQSTNGTLVNGKRIAAPMLLRDGAHITIGAHLLSYSRRSERETAEAQALDRELQEASRYVMAILPPPVDEGPVETEWFYLPCTRIGGDVFGYQAIDARHMMVFILDVSGHGAGAALHAVTVANVLRQMLLPNVDFCDPAAVVSGLNQRFQMQDHNGMMFTIWVGIYDFATRILAHCAAGHHAGFLAAPGPNALTPLATRNPSVGLLPVHDFVAAQTPIAAGSSLYLFSDGVFEIVDRDGRQWALEDLTALLEGGPKPPAPQALYEAIRATARPGPLDDDVSILAMRFP